jgi:hypothetical protein
MSGSMPEVAQCAHPLGVIGNVKIFQFDLVLRLEQKRI